MTMEVNYGVAITNKFALFLNEDEDPLDILRIEEELKAKKADKKKSPATDKDSKTKSKPTKVSESTTDAKKQADNVAGTIGQKKEADKPPRMRSKASPGDVNAVDKKPGKENDATVRRDKREDGSFRPRPQSATNRDAATRDGGNRPERADQGERRPYDRPNRGAPRFQRADRGGFVDRADRPVEFSVEKSDDGEKPFGPRIIPGRGRGSRQGGTVPGGRRAYDRHSGSDKSGVKPIEKKDGAGAHNWGTITDDIEEMNERRVTEEGTSTWAAQMEAADAAQTPADGAKMEEEGEANAVEEEQPVFTLDEWRAQQEAVRVKSEFKIRKAGEGCSTDPQWKKMFVLKKKEDEEAEEEEEEEDLEEDGHHGRQKNVVPIEIKFNVAPKRGFGGRGRGRGGRGGNIGGGGGSGGGSGGGAPVEEARAPRGGGSRRPAQKAPNVSDELDFPSLDKKVVSQ